MGRAHSFRTLLISSLEGTSCCYGEYRSRDIPLTSSNTRIFDDHHGL
jgi:hypothetical protein